MRHSRGLLSIFLLSCVQLVLFRGVAGLDIELIINSQVSCYGGHDGVATVNVIDGSPPYRYFWPGTNQNTATASNLPAGWHNVSVKDDAGVITKGVNILQPSRLVGQAYSFTNTASCDSSLGLVSAEAYGGTPPYTFTWESADNHFVVASAERPMVVYDEIIAAEFKLSDASGSVDVESTEIEAYSGILSLKVTAVKSQQFVIQCSDGQCIDSTKHRGLEFWVWKETEGDRFYVGLLDNSGEEHGMAEFSFAQGNWTKGFLDFSEVPPGTYTAISIDTNGGFSFYMDDIVLLPRTTSLIPAPNDSLPLPIGTPSGIYGPAGYYSVKISDNKQCGPQLLNLEIEKTMALQNRASVDGFTVTISTNGGTPPYTYTISTTSNYSTNARGVFSSLPPGNYTINVTDSRACNEQLLVTVTGFPITPTGPPIGPGINSDASYELINASLAVLSAICALLTLLCLYFAYRRRGDLRPHSLLFCHTVLFGAFVGYVAALLVLMDVTWTRCVAFAWTVDISVTIIYGTMFAKSMQILKILDNFTKFVSIDTTDRYMAKIFCIIFVPELILLVVWSGLLGTVLQNTVTAGESDVIFWNIFLVYKGIVGFIASFVCFRMRFKFKEYLEIQQIAYCHFTLEIVLVFMLVFTMVARERYNELFVAVQSFSVISIVSIPLLVIFVPILRRAVKDLKDEKRTKKWQKLTMYT